MSVIPSTTPKNSHKEFIDQELYTLLNHPGTLWEAAQYAVLGGGKRLRPLLAVATAKALGQDPKGVYRSAAAIEMIHAYSMIHDDLPAMDDDQFRRGRPTLHCAYDEATAILVGDMLLTLAFEVINEENQLSYAQRCKLSLALAKAAGGKGLILGQHLDLTSSGKECTIEDIKNIHIGKTAELISVSVQFGAIIAGVSSPYLATFGKQLGLAFQIIDDVLDVTSAATKHNRTSDIEQDKATYVKYLGVEGAKSQAEKELEKALSALRKIPADTEQLTVLARQFVHRSC